MQENIKGIVKPVEKNGKVLTHRDSSKEGVSRYYCFTFIKKKNVIVKGEYDNNKNKRTSLILLFNSKSGKIIGESSM